MGRATFDRVEMQVEKRGHRGDAKKCRAQSEVNRLIVDGQPQRFNSLLPSFRSRDGHRAALAAL
jgi:hypothetical protein